MRSITSSTQQAGGIELESGYTRTQKAKLPHHTRWIDNNHDIPSSRNISRSVGATTSVRGSDSERDDSLLMGINVQNTLHVENGLL